MRLTISVNLFAWERLMLKMLSWWLTNHHQCLWPFLARPTRCARICLGNVWELEAGIGTYGIFFKGDGLRMVQRATMPGAKRALLHHGACWWHFVLRQQRLLDENFSCEICSEVQNQLFRAWWDGQWNFLFEKENQEGAEWFSAFAWHQCRQGHQVVWRSVWKGAKSIYPMRRWNPYRGFICRTFLWSSFWVPLSSWDLPLFGPWQAGLVVYSEGVVRVNGETYSDSIAEIEKACGIFENKPRLLCSVGCAHRWTRQMDSLR